ncbi:hypothetical protein B0H14DRAFT_2601369 [Mycena olivaceomarginata]|nr:hypothetical protein B0H14DRAFT_2601369 [Mycena olivaceomarginata]
MNRWRDGGRRQRGGRIGKDTDRSTVLRRKTGVTSGKGTGEGQWWRAVGRTGTSPRGTPASREEAVHGGEGGPASEGEDRKKDYVKPPSKSKSALTWSVDGRSKQQLFLSVLVDVVLQSVYGCKWKKKGSEQSARTIIRDSVASGHASSMSEYMTQDRSWWRAPQIGRGRHLETQASKRKVRGRAGVPAKRGEGRVGVKPVQVVCGSSGQVKSAPTIERHAWATASSTRTAPSTLNPRALVTIQDLRDVSKPLAGGRRRESGRQGVARPFPLLSGCCTPPPMSSGARVGNVSHWTAPKPTRDIIRVPAHAAIVRTGVGDVLERRRTDATSTTRCCPTLVTLSLPGAARVGVEVSEAREAGSLRWYQRARPPGGGGGGGAILARRVTTKVTVGALGVPRHPQAIVGPALGDGDGIVSRGSRKSRSSPWPMTRVILALFALRLRAAGAPRRELPFLISGEDAARVEEDLGNCEDDRTGTGEDGARDGGGRKTRDEGTDDERASYRGFCHPHLLDGLLIVVVRTRSAYMHNYGFGALDRGMDKRGIGVRPQPGQLVSEG